MPSDAYDSRFEDIMGIAMVVMFIATVVGGTAAFVVYVFMNSNIFAEISSLAIAGGILFAMWKMFFGRKDDNPGAS